MNELDFETEFNVLLVETFHNILKTELKMINNITNSSLSMREVHLLELVAENKTSTVSKIAKSFEITMASVTVLVKKLVSCGYLIKNKEIKDARNINLALTKKGESINREHANFHKKMVKRITKNLSDNEKVLLSNGVRVLNDMFKTEFNK